MSTRSKTLDFFLKPKVPKAPKPNERDSSTLSDEPTSSEGQLRQPPLATVASTSASADPAIPPNDFGYAVDQVMSGAALSDGERLQLLRDFFTPGPDYDYPFTMKVNNSRQSGCEKRSLNKNHLESYTWLAYSPKHRGLFCRYCVLFGQKQVRGIQLGFLVNKPLVKFDKLLGDKSAYLTSHDRHDYHKMSVLKAEDCQKCLSNPSTSVTAKLHCAADRQKAQNFERLKSIASVALFLIKNGLPFRGHRDDGRLDLTEIDGANQDQGLFRDLMVHQSLHGDDVLRQHIESAAGNATYWSKTVQNDLIDIVGKLILNQLLSEVRNAKYFTVLADETADISGMEQLSYCARYFSSTDNQIKEVFLGFEHASDMTGRGLADMILKFFGETCQLDLHFLVGQGYDGASAMSGSFNGVQKLVRDICPCAAYTHCASHNLNLTLSSSLEDVTIRAVITEIGAIINFFQSAKRLAVLQAAIADHCPTSSHGRLQRYCATRWVERHDAVAVFAELFPAVAVFAELFPAVSAALETIQRWPGKDKASAQATSHLQAMNMDSFAIGLVVLRKVLSLTAPVSRSLQDPEVDLLQCMEQVCHINDELKQWRNSDEVFNSWFAEAEEIHGGPISCPRQVKRSIYAKKPPAESPRDFYRISTYYPVLDTMIEQLRVRFQSHETSATYLASLVPKHVASHSFQDLRPAYEMYATFLDGADAVESEFILWKRRWVMAASQGLGIPATVTEAIGKCSDLPNIRTLLLIFATIPVTTATAERSYSQLRLLKTYLRSTMDHERLSSLALGRVHRSITAKITVEDVASAFAERKQRRVDFGY